MSYESHPQHSKSQADEQKELINQLRGIKFTLIVGLIVLMIALAPWWLLGMGILMGWGATDHPTRPPSNPDAHLTPAGHRRDRFPA